MAVGYWGVLIQCGGVPIHSSSFPKKGKGIRKFEVSHYNWFWPRRQAMILYDTMRPEILSTF